MFLTKFSVNIFIRVHKFTSVKLTPLLCAWDLKPSPIFCNSFIIICNAIILEFIMRPFFWKIDQFLNSVEPSLYFILFKAPPLMSKFFLLFVREFNEDLVFRTNNAEFWFSNLYVVTSSLNPPTNKRKNLPINGGALNSIK